MKKTGSDIFAALEAAAKERILVLDGAMGTMIQNLQFSEAQFRGERFKSWNQDLKGNNDLLILTQPDAIRDIHLQYLKAGADIIETNTFSSTSIAQADYAMESIVYELNKEGARLCCEAVEQMKEIDPSPPPVCRWWAWANKPDGLDLSGREQSGLPRSFL